MAHNGTRYSQPSEVAETTTSVDDQEHQAGGELKFVVVPLVVVAAVMLLSALVYLMARKRKLDTLRHRLMPLYNFDKAEHESDWETEFLDSQGYTNYSTTNFNAYED